MKQILKIILILIGLSSCTNKETIWFYSLDKKNCISVMNELDTRYIIAGKHRSLPDSNYVKIDLSKVSQMGDCLWILWKENNKWEVVVHNAIILENRLDSFNYKFDDRLPENKDGIPKETKFRQENGAIYDFLTDKLSPNKGAIIERKSLIQ